MNWGLSSGLLHGGIDAANMLIELGYRQRKLAYSSISKETAAAEVAGAYSEIAMQYETSDRFETAISLLKRTLYMLVKLPQEQHSEESSAIIGWLLLLNKALVPYTLELDISRTIWELHIWNWIDHSERTDVCSCYHTDSIDACQNLSKAFGARGSFAEAGTHGMMHGRWTISIALKPNVNAIQVKCMAAVWKNSKHVLFLELIQTDHTATAAPLPTFFSPVLKCRYLANY
ncbi:hypothetical protein SADUNF_Sadunf02G0033000 [Salix dunnii]|uniref:Uncharacterized protein n=1 Tax=Salix dunnii TaxID=1413687 RepID=A0A835N5W7_9ROSI|nr:hypothetical protein SADUNF_Sadunf02G0033000 [Salix dunnii]